MESKIELNTTVLLDSEQQKLIVNLVYTYNFFLEKTLQALHSFNINDQHYNVLKALEHSYPSPISVGEIKQLLFNKRGDLTRLLDKLCSQGLVVREADLADRRVVLVSLSQKGKQQLREMDALLVANRDAAIHLTGEEFQQLNDLLNKLRG